MKKNIKMMLAAAAVTCIGIMPAFAISEKEAEQIVKREYPGAVIHQIDRDYERGRRVYEIEFQTADIWDGELTIDAETGRILKRDIDRRDSRHRRG